MIISIQSKIKKGIQIVMGIKQVMIASALCLLSVQPIYAQESRVQKCAKALETVINPAIETRQGIGLEKDEEGNWVYTYYPEEDVPDAASLIRIIQKFNAYLKKNNKEQVGNHERLIMEVYEYPLMSTYRMKWKVVKMARNDFLQKCVNSKDNYYLNLKNMFGHASQEIMSSPRLD